MGFKDQVFAQHTTTMAQYMAVVETADDLIARLEEKAGGLIGILKELNADPEFKKTAIGKRLDVSDNGALLRPVPPSLPQVEMPAKNGKTEPEKVTA